MVRIRSGVAIRLVVESAVSPSRYTGATVPHRLLPNGKPALAAELHRCEQVISTKGRRRFHGGAGASREPGRAPDGTAHGTDIGGLFQSRDTEPMAAL